MDDAARRRALRRIARRHHPDLGGDLSTYLDAVAALDHHPEETPGLEVRVRRRRGPARLLHLLRGRWRSWRASRRVARRRRAEAAIRARREHRRSGRRR